MGIPQKNFLKIVGDVKATQEERKALGDKENFDSNKSKENRAEDVVIEQDRNET